MGKMLSVISFGLASIGGVYANNNSNDNLYNEVGVLSDFCEWGLYCSKHDKE